MKKQFFYTHFHAYLIASLFAIIPHQEMAQAEANFVNPNYDGWNTNIN